MRRFLPSAVISFFAACVATAAAPAVARVPHPWCDAIVDVPPLKGAPSLAPGGTLRIGVNLGNPNNASLDPATGRGRGVAVDLACALAARLDVQLAFVTYAAIPPQLAGLNAGAFDVGFSFDPALAPREVRTAAPHIFIPNAYLVADASRFRRSADLDSPEVTIAVAQGNSPDVFLSGKLRAAKLRRVETVGAALALLAAGEVDAFAGSRAAEAAFIAKSFPKGQMLADDFMIAQLAMFVRADEAAAASTLTDFVDWARQRGLLRSSLERAHLAGALSDPP